jgi:hypothetical protein
MQTPEVAARALRRGIVGAERIEHFWLHASWQVHAASSNAPWQLKPAPNDDIHHHPDGALSRSAACIT